MSPPFLPLVAVDMRSSNQKYTSLKLLLRVKITKKLRFFKPFQEPKSTKTDQPGPSQAILQQWYLASIFQMKVTLRL